MDDLVAPAASSHGQRDDAVQRAMDATTSLIAQRRLSPGEQLRQEDLSQRLGLSRGPIREALKALSAQRIVRYERNRGYFVAQFSADEIAQIYELRRLAETSIYLSLEPPTAEVLEEVRSINAQIHKTDSVEETSALNDAFHLAIFNLSPKKVVRAEVIRWWKMTAGYRMLSLSIAGQATPEDHDEFIDALEAYDLDRLVAAADDHRAKSARNLLPLIPRV